MLANLEGKGRKAVKALLYTWKGEGYGVPPLYLSIIS